jgi:hypothetical protein
MSYTIKRKKSWLLRAELAAIICLACICVVKDGILKLDIVKAKGTKQAVNMDQNHADKAVSLEYVITSILYSRDNPSVVMSDGTIVREEDVIGGAKIVKIHKDKVELEKDGKNWTQKIGERLTLHVR